MDETEANRSISRIATGGRTSRRVLTTAACAALTMPALAVVHAYSPILVNWTQSLPVGLYLKTSDPKAPDIVFCLDHAAENDAKRLGIRLRGSCPDGSMPELKTEYVATPQQPIMLTKDGIWYRGKLLPNTAPVLRTPSGKTMVPYRFGTYASGRWAISTYAALSYDSRYFGPVQDKQILSRARPLWTW